MRLSRFVFCALITIAFAVRSEAAKPKLVVAILVDQLRYDYLERFSDQFGPQGFRTLIDGGAFMTFAHYNYFPTLTGPGHASFLSGTTPASHGIISNDWLDRRTLKLMNCVSDESVEPVGTTDEYAKRSPRNFIGSNFADEFRLRFRSKVVGVSLKDRGAILPAGKKPAGAYWFDSTTGCFVTSTYYRSVLPAWVDAFNAKNEASGFIGQKWTRLLDASAYHFPDEAAGEGLALGERAAVFDHTVQPSPTEGFETIVPTPFGNQLLTDFAIATIDGEQLGSGAEPDLLCVSYSSIDAGGHRYGPYSQEVQDLTLRLDRELARLFSHLDKKLGLANVTIVLTADHGVAPTPEFATAQGFDGQRFDGTKVLLPLVDALNSQFGAADYLLTPALIDGNLYFDHDVLRTKKIAPAQLASFIRDWAFARGRFQAIYTRDQLLEGRAPGAIGQRVINGFHTERSGDMVFIYKPYSIPYPRAGTTHGSPFGYDTHVPVLFFGEEFKRGRFNDDFQITDIVPTLCSVLRMNEPPASIGRPATSILAEAPAPAAKSTPAPRRK